MKKQAYTLIAMFVLVGSLAVGAQAQMIGVTELIANIPFEFNVGSKALPAGEYKISRVNPASNQLMLLRSKDGRTVAMVPMISVTGKTPESTKLIFRRYGNHYFFAQAWVDGDASGLEAPRSRAERAAQRQLATLKPTAEAVALRTR